MQHIQIWKPHSGYMDRCIRNRLGVWKDGATLQPENFLLSYQSIRIFPCAPPTGEIVMENFAAEGGFLVSAVRTAEGEIEDVRIVSRLGGPCRMAGPWPECGVIVETGKGEQVAAAAPRQGHVEFATQPGCCYQVRACTDGDRP